MTETLTDGHKIMTLYNHDWSSLLGSTADNMTLAVKDDGLYFEFIPKNHDFDRRIIDFIKGGTIDGCSIGFRTTKDTWEEKGGQLFRTVEKVILYEVTFTPIPAYEQTSIGIEVRKATGSETEAAIREECRQLLADVERTLNSTGLCSRIKPAVA